MKRNKPSPPKLTVIVHDVRSILNVGAIFRTADAAGAGMVWLTGYTPGPDTHPNKMAKTALGAQMSVPWGRMRRVGDVVRKLRRQGVHIVALEQTEKSADYRRFKPQFPLALIVGNEVKGIGAEHMSHKPRITTSEISQSGTRLCNMKNMSHNLVDACIEIPMRGEKESLNVAVALGIAVYELTRRWN